MKSGKEWVIVIDPQHANEIIDEIEEAALSASISMKHSITPEAFDEPWILIIDWLPSDNMVSLYPLDATSHDPSIANILITSGSDIPN